MKAENMHQAIPSLIEPVFCCGSACPTNTSENKKPFNDPNRPEHDDIFYSFLRFQLRRQGKFESDCRSLKIEPKSNVPQKTPGSLPRTPPQEPWIPEPVLSPETLASNPITANTTYCIHVTSRHNYDLVYSHRYYAIPQNINDDWVEISKVHWFAEGYSFRKSVDDWDFYCKDDDKFFRMELRPNLRLRQTVQLEVEDVGGKDIALRHESNQGSEVVAGASLQDVMLWYANRDAQSQIIEVF